MATAIAVAAVAQVEIGRRLRTLNDESLFDRSAPDIVTALAWTRGDVPELLVATAGGRSYRFARSVPGSAVRQSGRGRITGLLPSADAATMPSVREIDDKPGNPRPRWLMVEGRAAARGLAARLSNGGLLTGEYAAVVGRPGGPPLVDALRLETPQDDGAPATGDRSVRMASSRLDLAGANVTRLAPLPTDAAAVAGDFSGRVFLVGPPGVGSQAAQGLPPGAAVTALSNAHTAPVTGIAVAARPEREGVDFATAAQAGNLRIWRKGINRAGRLDATSAPVQSWGRKAEWVKAPPEVAAAARSATSSGDASGEFRNKQGWLEGDPFATDSRWLPGAYSNLRSRFGPPVRAAVDRDGHLVAVATRDNIVRIYDAPDGSLRQPIVVGSAIQALAFDPKGARLAIAGSAAVTIVETSSGAALAAYPPPGDDGVAAMAWSEDGKSLTFGNRFGDLVRVDWRRGAAAGPLARVDREPRSDASFSVDETGLFWLRHRSLSRLDLVDMKLGRVLATLEDVEPKVSSLVVESSGARIWQYDSDGSAALYRRDPDDIGEQVETPPVGEDGLKLSAAGTALLLRTPDGELWAARLVDDAGQRIAIPRLRQLAEPSVAIDADLSADGERVIAAGEDGVVRVRRLPWAGADARAFDLPGHGDVVHRLSVSPDGGALATASVDGRVRVTDLWWAERIALLPGALLPTGPDVSPAASRFLVPGLPRPCPDSLTFRLAAPSDFVCVSAEVRNETAQENAQAAQRRSSTGGAYGPNTCLQGFVWREAFEGDITCVTPDSRARARAQSAAAQRAQAN